MSKSKTKPDLLDVQAIDAALATRGATPPLAGQNAVNRSAAKDKIAYASAAHVKNSRPVISPVKTPEQLQIEGHAAADQLRDTDEMEAAARGMLAAVDQLAVAVHRFGHIAVERRQLAVTVAKAAYPAHAGVARQVGDQLGEMAGLTSLLRIYTHNAVLKALPGIFSALPHLQDRGAEDELTRLKDHVLHKLEQLLPAELV